MLCFHSMETNHSGRGLSLFVSIYFYEKFMSVIIKQFVKKFYTNGNGRFMILSDFKLSEGQEIFKMVHFLFPLPR